jgi:hypothetical protein
MPPWNRLPPLLDDEILASKNGAVMDSDTGKYKELIYRDGLKTKDAALDIRRALYRAAKRQKVGLAAAVEQRGSEFVVRYQAINKDHAKAYVAAKYGANMPYNAFQRKAE